MYDNDDVDICEVHNEVGCLNIQNKVVRYVARLVDEDMVFGDNDEDVVIVFQ